MKFINSLTLVAGLLSTASAFTADPDLEERDVEAELEVRKAGCARGVHVVALGGQGTTDGDMGYLETLVYNITGKIPHSDIKQIGYPKGWLGPQVIPWAIPKLKQHLHAYVKGCPHTPIVLASYSVGGSATMDTLCGSPQTGGGALKKHFRHHIIANVVYGDLTYVSGKHYDRGTCTKRRGIVPRIHPGACFPFGHHTRSYCDHGDVNCCSGDIESVHFSYPRKYDHKASHFVAKRHRQHRRNHHKGHHHHKGHKGHKH